MAWDEDLGSPWPYDDYPESCEICNALLDEDDENTICQDCIWDDENDCFA